MAQTADQVHASLFVTCIVDQLYPQVGVSAVRVLRRLGVEVDFPLDQTCCGQPLLQFRVSRARPENWPNEDAGEPLP